MSDEEKKAINDLKTLKLGISFLNCIPGVEKDETDIKAIDVILNLIDNQQKEIEELKKYEEGYKLLRYALENYISKDKIKAKIEELEKEEKVQLKGTKGQDRYEIKQEYMYKRSGLQSLLEEE